MTLNLDCLRAVMLYIQKYQVFETVDLFGDGREQTGLKRLAVPSKETDTVLAEFNRNDITYCCYQAIVSDMLEGSEIAPLVYCVHDITPNGHDFIAALENDSVWKKLKEMNLSLGKMSLPVVMKVAADLLVKRFGL